MLKRKLFLLILFFFVSAKAFSFSATRIGNEKDVKSVTKPLICLSGGGDNDDWADAWKVFLAAAEGGDVVTIKANENADYNSWIYFDEGKHGFAKVNSVTRLVLSSKGDAELEEAVRILDNAEAIFIAGGNQNEYIDFYSGTKVEAAINRALHDRKIPVGGTSAGMAVLSGITYAAHIDIPDNDGQLVTSQDALSNPMADYVDLEYDFLSAPFLKNLITETHFDTREREGRIIAFMAKAIHKLQNSVAFGEVKAIAADETAAYCYDQFGAGKVYGKGSVYFLRAQENVEQLQLNLPLVWDRNQKAVSTYIVPAKNTDNSFNLDTWTGSSGRSEYWSVPVSETEEISVLRKEVLKE